MKKTPQTKEEFLNEYKNRFMYPCSGCTDPNSEGTHQMESIQHFEGSESEAFLDKVWEEARRETAARGEIKDFVRQEKDKSYREALRDVRRWTKGRNVTKESLRAFINRKEKEKGNITEV